MSTLDIKARPVSLFYLGISIILIIIFYILMNGLFTNAQNVTRLGYFEIKQQDAPLSIGRNELAQKKGPRSGEEQHIHLVFDEKQGWKIANIAQFKRVDAPGGGYKTRYLKRFRLQEGDLFKIAGEEISVKSADKQLRLQHEGTSQQLIWQGGQTGNIQTFQLGNTINPAKNICPEDADIKNEFSPIKVAVTDRLAMLGWQKKEESRLFSIGGSVTCLRHWGLFGDEKPLLEPDSARIVWLDNSYWLAPGAGEQNGIRFKHKNDSHYQSFDRIYTPFLVDGKPNIEMLIIGRSSYNVSVTEQNSLLLTQASGDVWLAEEWEHHKARTRAANNHPWPNMEEPGPFGTEAHTLLNLLCILSIIASIGLAMAGRLRTHSGWLWTVSLVLLFIGNLVLLQLAIGGLSERFLGLAMTFLKMSVLYLILLCVLSRIPLAWLTKRITVLLRIQQHQSNAINLALYGLLSLYIVLLITQAASGSESGLGFFQPVEFSKFIIILISVISASQYYEKRYLDAFDESGKIAWSIRQSIRLFFRLAVLVSLAFLMLALVRDFSPIVLILLYLLVFTLRILPHPDKGSFNKSSWVICSLLLMTMCLPAYVLISTKLSGIPPAFLMNADRFQVWANPAQYPHSGSQVIDSMTLIANSKAWGKSWFGLNSNQVMQLPAVQDDFIATFLISHFGYFSGLGLLALQLVFVWQLVRLSSAFLRDGRHLHDSTLARHTAYSGSLFCFGFAGLLLAHWLISWSNVLGLLPVMGQPMSMLSIGGSNLILFVAPCLLLCFCFAWIKEQSPA